MSRQRNVLNTSSMRRGAPCGRLRTALLFLWVISSSIALVARAAEEVTVQVRPGQSVQDIASEYLGDAALWPSILEHNGLRSSDQVVPWMQLRIPATGLATAALAVNQAQVELNLATQVGGRLFAGGLLDQSKQKLTEAQEALKRREYAPAQQFAEAAFKLAQQARRVASSASNVAVQAVLQTFSGVVETQRPDELTWRRAEPRVRLVEGERIRTRSGSSAEILFRDNSRLRLNANSLAVIREMRQDVLLSTNRSSVALIQGDVLAYLAELRESNRFDLELPGIKTNIQSRSFWVNRDEQQTSRIAVYDGQISVVAAGDSVIVRQNEGTTVRPQRAPERPRMLLPSPVVRGPEDARTFYNEYPTLRWSSVAGARSYRLEVAQDRRFYDIAVLIPELQTRSYTPQRLTRGVYYWRVSAVDSLAFPGPPSATNSFIMQFDKLPPFIVIKYPRRMISFTNESVFAITGEAEEGVVLLVNGQPVQGIRGDQFRHTATLADGENRFSITARDSGGNVTTIERRIVRQQHAPSVEILGIESDELSFVVNTPFLTMSGQTESGARMVLWQAAEGHATDSLEVPVRPDGNFTFTIQLPAPGLSERILESIDRAGNRGAKQIRVKYDNVPPFLALETPSYVVTQADTIVLAGQVEEGCALLINQQAVADERGRFAARFPLVSGHQFFTLTAEDDAGSQTVARSEVVRDADAPRLGNWTMVPRRVRGGEVVTITVRAQDEHVGLPRTARYRVSGPSGFSRDGVLVCRAGNGEFSARFPVPPGVQGSLRLEWVELSDILGNSRSYSLAAQ